jgi:hypothetical protein
MRAGSIRGSMIVSMVETTNESNIRTMMAPIIHSTSELPPVGVTWRLFMMFQLSVGQWGERFERQRFISQLVDPPIQSPQLPN